MSDAYNVLDPTICTSSIVRLGGGLSFSPIRIYLLHHRDLLLQLISKQNRFYDGRTAGIQRLKDALHIVQIE